MTGVEMAPITLPMTLDLVGDRITRVRVGDGLPPPSLALLRPVRAIGPAPQGWALAPVAERRGGKWCMTWALERGTSLYGVGEAAGPLVRAGTPSPDSRTITCWNSDDFEYSDHSPSLYQSHPWVLIVHADGSATGVLCDTTLWCRVVLGARSLRFLVRPHEDVKCVAAYVIERDHPADVVCALADLTGKLPMPPRWALGFHQCRYSYLTAERALAVAREFRRRDIPCDAIWLDIDHMDGYRCFTFDPERFPDPRALSDGLHSMGFHGVWMADPGIKAEEGYSVYDSGREADVFVRTASGDEYRGSVWPGPCAFPDFLSAAARDWWGGLHRAWLDAGIDGVWNDMNEPSIFDGPERTMPLDNRHRADPELGGPGDHARYHNVYGMQMVRGTCEAMRSLRPDRRPFVLTRAGFVGSQRYAATWTGDNVSEWTHLAWSIPMALGLGLSAQPLAGPDIGGFSGDASGALFARWMGIGALLPFARAHSDRATGDHEPWSFGEACERVCRLALQRRYRLLPYLYTLLREASATGMPIVRPLMFVDPRDPALRGVDDAFLLGGDVLVRAQVRPARPIESPMPPGRWAPFELAEEDDPALPRLLVRGGSIVPAGPMMAFADQRPLDPLTLLVCLDEAGEAVGTLYEDAGDGHEHESGAYRLATYRARREGGRVVVELAERAGGWPVAARELEVVLVGEGEDRPSVRGRDGERVVLG